MKSVLKEGTGCINEALQERSSFPLLSTSSRSFRGQVLCLFRVSPLEYHTVQICLLFLLILGSWLQDCRHLCKPKSIIMDYLDDIRQEPFKKLSMPFCYFQDTRYRKNDLRKYIWTLVKLVNFGSHNLSMFFIYFHHAHKA